MEMVMRSVQSTGGWSELQCYLRWNGHKRTIKQIRKLFGVTLDEIREAYDSIMRPEGGFYPLCQFAEPEPDGLSMPNVALAPAIKIRERDAELDAEIINDFKSGLTYPQISQKRGVSQYYAAKVVKPLKNSTPKKEKNAERIAGVLSTTSKTVTEIFIATGIPKNIIQTTLYELKKRGVAVNTGKHGRDGWILAQDDGRTT